jgi:hypothetical protein
VLDNVDVRLAVAVVLAVLVNDRVLVAVDELVADCEAVFVLDNVDV